MKTAPRHDTTTPGGPAEIDADLHYLEEARAALRRMIPLSDAASGRAAGRTCARWRATHWSCRAAGSRRSRPASSPGPTGGRAPAVSRGRSLPGLHGTALDRAYADQLTAHVHTSMAAARAEMVAGVSGGARAIAEGALRAQSHQLAALDLLPPVAPPPE